MPQSQALNGTLARPALSLTCLVTRVSGGWDNLVLIHPRLYFAEIVNHSLAELVIRWSPAVDAEFAEIVIAQTGDVRRCPGIAALFCVVGVCAHHVDQSS